MGDEDHVEQKRIGTQEDFISETIESLGSEGQRVSGQARESFKFPIRDMDGREPNSREPAW